MPETIFYALADHAGFFQDKSCKVLDIGCGDGLCGSIMKVIF